MGSGAGGRGEFCAPVRFDLPVGEGHLCSEERERG